MINLQNEYQKAIEAKNTVKQEFIIQLQKLFLKAKDKPPNELSAENQLLLAIVQNIPYINSQEFDALLISLDRKNEVPHKGGLLKAS